MRVPPSAHPNERPTSGRCKKRSVRTAPAVHADAPTARRRALLRVFVAADILLAPDLSSCPRTRPRPARVHNIQVHDAPDCAPRQRGRESPALHREAHQDARTHAATMHAQDRRSNVENTRPETVTVDQATASRSPWLMMDSIWSCGQRAALCGPFMNRFIVDCLRHSIGQISPHLGKSTRPWSSDIDAQRARLEKRPRVRARALAVIVMDTKRVSPHRFECHTPTKITSPRRMHAPSRAGRAATGTQSPRCARRSDHEHERLGSPLRACPTRTWPQRRILRRLQYGQLQPAPCH